jgi:tetratricopeptide (TPR) repeat protein
MQARLLLARGKTEAALQALMQLTDTALTAEENFKLRLQLASLFFQAGNIRAFKAEFNRLTELPIPKHKDAQLSVSLLKAQVLETDAAFEDAKATLEDAFEYCTSSQDKAVCYVNLGRLEDLRHNQQTALSYYERAWIELKQAPIPRYFQIVAHNLLMKYAQVGAINQANALLGEYRQMVASHAPDQLLGFYNDLTDFSRQIGDKSLLVQSYEGVANLSGFDTKARYCIAAHELRMRLGDGLSFMPTFESVFERLPMIELTEDERFRTLEQIREAWHLGQSLFAPQSWHAYGCQIHLQYIANEPIVDDRLRMTPPSLPAIKDVWLKRKLEILRIKIGMYTPSLTADSFEPIFSLAAERCRLWSDCENIRQAVETQLVYVDDFMAYERQAAPATLARFKDGALSTLAEAEQLLDKHWPTPAVEQAIGIAYLSWKLTGDIAKRDRWLARFESRGLSLEHFQPWLREQYREMRRG